MRGSIEVEGANCEKMFRKLNGWTPIFFLMLEVKNFESLDDINEFLNAAKIIT